MTVAALVVAKSVQLADMMPFINRFPGNPLLWNVVWKTSVYFFVAAVIHYLERLGMRGMRGSGLHKCITNMQFCSLTLFLHSRYWPN